GGSRVRIDHHAAAVRRDGRARRAGRDRGGGESRLGVPRMTARFVAEVSSNHNRDLGRAIAFVETASRLGCAAVKFQLFNVDDLFAPEILAKSPKHRLRAGWELPEP